MTIKGTVFAIIGTMIGTGIWYGAAEMTGTNYAWLSLAIGLGAAVGSILGDADGATAGLFCGVLALFASVSGHVQMHGSLSSFVDESGGMGYVFIILTVGIAAYFGNQGKQ